MDDLGNRDGNQTLRDDGTVNFVVDDDTNHYTSIGGHSITHDEAGNMTQDRQGYRYQYDYENRISRIFRMDGQNEVTVATFEYDALGRRIRKVDSVASETTLYYYDPDWRCLEEWNDSDTFNRLYVLGNYIDEVVFSGGYTGSYYYLHDHLYSVVALIGYVDPSWVVVERYEYDAYGTVQVMDSSYNNRTTSSYDNSYAFTGRRLDELDSDNMEIMYYRHRYFDPYAGRFLQHDQLGMHVGDFPFEVHDQYIEGINLYESQYADGMNLYQYVVSNPINYVDPMGLEKKCPLSLWSKDPNLTFTQGWRAGIKKWGELAWRNSFNIQRLKGDYARIGRRMKRECCDCYNSVTIYDHGTIYQKGPVKQGLQWYGLGSNPAFLGNHLKGSIIHPKNWARD